MSTAPSSSERRVKIAYWAVQAVFFGAGFGYISWAARMPAIRAGLGVSKGQMGAMLFAVALGSILAMPLAGPLTTRIRVPSFIRITAAINLVGIAAIGISVAAHLPWLFVIAAFVAGIGVGSWDVAMNLEGAEVEHQLGRAVMPQFHGGYSIGTVAGAALAAVATALRLPLTIHLAIVIGMLAVGVFWATSKMLPTRAAEPAPSKADRAPGEVSRFRQAIGAWLEPRTLLIGLVVLACSLTEGSSNDWTAMAVIDTFAGGNVHATVSILGHSVPAETLGTIILDLFLVAMTAGRLFGTRLLDRFGRVIVLRAAAAAAFVGLMIFCLSDSLALVALGSMLWGVGASLGFPVGMSAASDDPLRAAQRVSVVATIGYTAFLAGPPLLGWLSDNIGLRHALMWIGVPIVIGFLLTGVMAKPKDKSGSSAAASGSSAGSLAQ